VKVTGTDFYALKALTLTLSRRERGLIIGSLVGRGD
jgi:hypothetical protein